MLVQWMGRSCTLLVLADNGRHSRQQCLTNDDKRFTELHWVLVYDHGGVA